MAVPELAALSPGLAYTNQRVADIPWSIHVIRLSRAGEVFGLQSVHASNQAIGMATLSRQLKDMPPAWGQPVAAVNGDFYQRERAFAGDSRGLQISHGEMLSAPQGVCLWVDASGQPHTTNVASRMEVTWPDNTQKPFGLNEDRKPNALVLYSPAIGSTTHTEGGREFILEPTDGATFPTLAPDLQFKARIREIRPAGNSPVTTNSLVLSAGPALVKSLPPLQTNDLVSLSTATQPSLLGATAAIAGGPVLVRGGQAQKIELPDDESYQFKSMIEPHPRSAIGWNRDHFYLVTVDGRQKASLGMTLEELAEYMARLGCDEAMNLDGGGSAMLWGEGRIRNQPSDGKERPIANSLVFVRREPSPAQADTPKTTPH